MSNSQRVLAPVLAADIHNYIDHICIQANRLQSREHKIEINDANRYLHHFVRQFRKNADRHDTSLIMLAICRRRLYKYVALADDYGVDFNISQCAQILGDIEQYAKVTEVQVAIKA